MNKEDISVLVCDDSALMRNLISRIIENTQGLSVCAKAMNGEIALEKIAEAKPDVIVLDIEMPVMNGIEFLRERKKRKMDIPVIILSSIATEGASVTMEALELGASDFLTKPNGSVTADLSSVADRLVELLSSYGFAYAIMHGKDVYEPDFFIRQIKLREAERFVLEQKKEKITHKAIQKVTYHDHEHGKFDILRKKDFSERTVHITDPHIDQSIKADYIAEKNIQ